MSVTVSIQGYEGSFHQIAAQKFFGNKVSVIPCATFSQVVKIASDKNRSTGGVMAIENSIAGSILPNYHLLKRSNLKIIGEIYLQIHQNLLVNPGVTLEDIREVHSHPMALLQCTDYLESHPHWKLVETEDTALSAKYIQQRRHKYAAAIASTLAAELFRLDIIAPKVQTDKNNYTRFLIIAREEDKKILDSADKASLNFRTDHTRGSLAKVLAKIADEGLNLTKIQSFPIAGSGWKYQFYVDTEFDAPAQLYAALKGMEPITQDLHIQGIYKRGKIVTSK